MRYAMTLHDLSSLLVTGGGRDKDEGITKSKKKKVAYCYCNAPHTDDTVCSSKRAIRTTDEG